MWGLFCQGIPHKQRPGHWGHLYCEEEVLTVLESVGVLGHGGICLWGCLKSQARRLRGFLWIDSSGL